MNPNQIIESVKSKLNQAVAHFEEELKKIRTGRAHPAMLDGLNIKAYGVFMPLKQVATVSAPEGQLLQITPFDPSNISAISDAIREDQTLGLNPADDGRVIRVPIPPLSTERRQEIVKQLREKVEEAMIAARNTRHDGLETAKKAKSDKQMGEDDLLRVEKQVDEMMFKVKQQVEALAASKEKRDNDRLIMIKATSLKTLIYLLSLLAVVFLWRYNFVLTIVLLVLAVTVLAIDKFADYKAFIICGLLGAGAEALAIYAGAWHYSNDSFAGIPLWLPPLWAIASRAMGSIYNIFKRIN